MRLAPLQLVLALGVAHRPDRGVAPRATSPRLAEAAPPLIRLPAPPRLVAVGDVHGDVRSLLEVLELAGLYSEAERRWTGGRAVLVQIGDVLDRGDDEAACLELLRELKVQAAEAGGAVLTLLGNHEVMNVCGVAGPYISTAGRTAFGSDRAAAFAPGGALAREMSTWPVVCVVGDTAFCHAGLTFETARDAAQINAEAARWLCEGAARKPPPSLMPTTDAAAATSPVWMRTLSSPSGAEPAPPAAASLTAALAHLGASRLVVGHTPQRQINCACDGTVWRIDVALSKAMGGGAIEALEIDERGVRVLTQRGAPVDAARRQARARRQAGVQR